MRSPTRSSAATSPTCATNSATCCCRSSFTRGWREEQGAFDFGGVVEAITDKMIRRHPHVFGDARDLSPDQVKALWGEIKAEEKRARAEARARGRARRGVPASALPALTRALKLQEKAGKVGFDWNDARAVIAKIREEIDEVEAELDAGRRDRRRGGSRRSAVRRRQSRAPS